MSIRIGVLDVPELSWMLSVEKSAVANCEASTQQNEGRANVCGMRPAGPVCHLGPTIVPSRV